MATTFALAFIMLIWVSFAGDAGLPTLTGNSLLFSLAVAVIVPYLVYAASTIYDRSRS